MYICKLAQYNLWIACAYVPKLFEVIFMFFIKKTAAMLHLITYLFWKKKNTTLKNICSNNSFSCSLRTKMAAIKFIREQHVLFHMARVITVVVVVVVVVTHTFNCLIYLFLYTLHVLIPTRAYLKFYNSKFNKPAYMFKTFLSCQNVFVWYLRDCACIRELVAQKALE